MRAGAGAGAGAPVGAQLRHRLRAGFATLQGTFAQHMLAGCQHMRQQCPTCLFSTHPPTHPRYPCPALRSHAHTYHTARARSFKYPGRDDFGMKNMNIGIDMGSRVAIVGPNGAGEGLLGCGLTLPCLLAS